MLLHRSFSFLGLAIGLCGALQQPLVSIDDQENPLLVAVMGPTGAGKSSFINSILGSDRFVVGKALRGQTNRVEDELVRVNGQLVRLVDTPGFDDTNMTDTHVLDMIVTWMGVQYKQKTKFAGILYMRDITEWRMKGSDVRNLRMFRALCGTAGLENVVVVTTKWNMMTHTMELAEDREKELLDDYLKPMLASGAEYARDDGTSQSSRGILRKMLQKDKAFYLDVQREIVDEGKRLNQVEAGKVFQEQLLEARQEYEDRLKSLSEELKHSHSKEMREALEEQQAKATQAIRRAEAAQHQLNEEYGKRFEEQEKVFRDMMEKLRQDYDEKLERASDEEREKLLKQQQELNRALKAADKGDSSVMWSVLGQAALTTGINFVLPLLLSQLVPKLGFGGPGIVGGAAGGALPAAPAAAAVADEVDLGQILNFNYFIDHMGEVYMQEKAMPSMGTLTDTAATAFGGDFSMTDWIVKGIENVAMPLVDLVDLILD